MSSSTAPIYNFTGINFNSGFFSSSSLTASSLKSYFLSKNNTDICTGIITYNGSTNFTNSLNLTSSTNTGNIQFTDFSNTNTLGSIYCSNSSMNINYGSLTDGFNVRNLVGESMVKVDDSGLTLNGPLQLGYTTVPDFTTNTALSGFSYGTSTLVDFTMTAVGVSTIYNNNGAIALPVGVYLLIAYNTLSLTGFSGTVNSSTTSFGYTIGTSSTPASNTKFTLYLCQSNQTYSNITLCQSFNVSGFVTVSSADTYISPFSIMTISGTVSGSARTIINSYKVMRIA